MIGDGGKGLFEDTQKLRVASVFLSAPLPPELVAAAVSPKQIFHSIIKGHILYLLVAPVHISVSSLLELMVGKEHIVLKGGSDVAPTTLTLWLGRHILYIYAEPQCTSPSH